MPADYQSRVAVWTRQCFGEAIAADRTERNHRFLEEAIELVQANGCTASEAHQLVDYVFGREAGDRPQEIGGVMVTLAALCSATGDNMRECAEIELERCWAAIERIRAKQAAKPKHSPLPQSTAPTIGQAEFNRRMDALDRANPGPLKRLRQSVAEAEDGG